MQTEIRIRKKMKIKAIIPEYLKYIQVIGRSHYTIRGARFILLRFARYLEKERIYNIEDLTFEVIEDYQQELAFSLTAKGTPLSVSTQVKQLNTVTLLTRYLKEKDYLVNDPGKKIKLPREPKRLPKSILSQLEIKHLMNAPDMQSNNGYRDRIMLEILYDTAIRRSELSNIKIHDLELNGGFVKVLGKGDKERVVPLSKGVCELIQNYLRFIRPALVTGTDHGYLLVNDKGGRIRVHTIWKNIKHCARLANLKKNITTHTFRHTCATHMLKNGAPIRHLQEMLGHASLESTQIYTHVTINDLKEIHAKYHPGANKE